MAKVISTHVSRQTGTHVQVIDNRDFSEDTESPWLTVCVEHGGLCGHVSRSLAMYFAPVPNEWCPGCQNVEEGRPADWNPYDDPDGDSPAAI